MRVGDVLRVGSVGLVVTEVHCGEMGGYHFLPDDTVDRLVRDTAVAVKSDDMTSSMNGELIQEGEVGVATEAQGGTPVAGPIGTPMAGATGSGFKTSSDNGSGGTEDSASECDEKTCYMCFDDHNEEENPLVSPCNCIGDTQVRLLDKREGILDCSVLIYKVCCRAYYNATGTIGAQRYAICYA